MKRKKSELRARVAYLCRFTPEPEGGFTVTCPKLPPVVSYGETLEEAQANAREAIELCLEVMRGDGWPIPPPDQKCVGWVARSETHPLLAGVTRTLVEKSKRQGCCDSSLSVDAAGMR